MKIGLIGAGMIGSTVGKLWIDAGHEVCFATRHPDEVQSLVKKLGAGASAGTPKEAARFGEVVMLSVPLAAIPQVAGDIAPLLAGKVVLDTGNAYERRDGLAARDASQHARGSAGWAAAMFPGARWVKAFNTVYFKTLEKEAHRERDRVAIPLASDDRGALDVASRLVEDAGFDPVIVGDLARGKEFEPGTKVYNTGMTGAEVRKILLSFIFLLLGGMRAAVGAEPPKPYSVAEIRGGLYWVTDGLYNTMFLVSSEGVIAIDPLPNLGPNYLQAIAEVTDKPVKYVIYSHEHTDHIGAANLFPKTATIIAQRETAELLAKRNDPRRPVPTVVFDKTYTLRSGDQELQLVYDGINHEKGNIFIYAPKQKVLMLVDVVYPGWVPYKNLGIGEDIPGYIAAHRRALGFDFDTLVAGHVERLGTRADVQTSLDFATDLQQTMSRLMNRQPFPAYLRSTRGGKSRWERHNDYELGLVNQCFETMASRWGSRLNGIDAYLKDDCWAMLESLAVQFGPVPHNEDSVADNHPIH